MHPKVATLLPVRHLGEIRNDEYFMALSHLCDYDAYWRFFANRSSEGSYVLLDNSEVELEEPEDFESFLIKARRVKASEIMLPDYFEDSTTTLAEARRCIKRVSDSDFSGALMVIPQGETLFEWIDCLDHMLSFKEVSTIGISCRYTDMFGGSRAIGVAMVHQLAWAKDREDVKIHLLGCYAEPSKEVALLLRHPRVKGIDSSYPAVFTAHGMAIYSGEPRPSPRGVDFLNDFYNRSLLRVNLESWWAKCLNPDFDG